MERATLVRSRLWMGVALLHLSLVAVGASGLTSGMPGSYKLTGPAGFAWDFYGRFTGASFGYSFFTPGIFTQLQARFEVTDDQGRTHRVPFPSGRNSEEDLRTITVLDQFKALEEEKRPEKEIKAYHRTISASLARGYFRQFPDTKRVTVRLENYEPVSVEEFLEGEQPHISLYYQAQYTFNPKKK